MKVLITGGSGIIGRGLAEKLLASGHEVLVYDIGRETMPAGARFVEGDVTDFDWLAGAAEGCEVGIHLAILSGTSRPADVLSVNVLGAYGFLQAARGAGFRNAIIVGSAPVHLPAPAHDDGVLGPTEGVEHPYDLSKTLQEVVARDFHSHGLPVMCLRLGHVVRGKEATDLDGTVSLKDEHYCRGGWAAIEDVIEACAAALTVAPNPDKFEIFSVVGSRSAREGFRVAATEARLGMRFQFDFAAYERDRPVNDPAGRARDSGA
jgi:nucleoside-diphosphate-sugar epimerase